MEENPISLPEKLPNPYKLTITGAVSAEYDGSETVEVKIPEIAGTPGEPGADGGYYVPTVAQEVSGTMSVSFTSSEEDMPAVPPTTIALPVGP